MRRSLRFLAGGGFGAGLGPRRREPIGGRPPRGGGELIAS
jgi:hypothetical protein